MELDGKTVSSWAERARPEDLKWLVGSEYSDSEHVWSVSSANHVALEIIENGINKAISRPFSFFATGTFFISDETGRLVSGLIDALQTPAERKVAEANEYLSHCGFSPSKLGGDSNAIFLFKAIKDFKENGQLLEGDQWEELHAILNNGDTSVMRCGAKFVAQWVGHSESQFKGCFDVRRRVLLAVLHRHTGELDKSLSVSAVVDRPKIQLIGGDSSIAVLCTTRGATLMDAAEGRPSQWTELLRKARKSLDRANAISEGDSEEIRNAYMRLKKLENQRI